MREGGYESLGSFAGVIGELRSLLVLDSKPGSVEDAVLGFLRGVADVKNICVVAFLPGGKSECFCENAYTVQQKELAASVSKRLCGNITQLTEWPHLESFMSEKERAALVLKTPVFVPLLSDGASYGALWCEYREEGCVTRKKNNVLVVASEVLCISFRNRYYYRSLARHENAMTRILESLDANIYISDLKTDEILFINKKMREEFGLDVDVVGKKCWKALQSGMTERCEFCPSNVLVQNADKPIVWEEHNTATGKYYKNTDSIIEWINGENAHLQHSVDITLEKSVQQSLLEAKQAADSANKAKSDFLSRMSHEIRTPLNAIIGMSRIALGVTDLEKTKECLRKIDTSSQHLLGLINDILDMSKIEASKMDLVHEPFDFEEMLIDIAGVISVKSEEKFQKLHIHMDMDMPRFYLGDEMRISQVITNLLSNAVKFTPQYGTVRMDVRELVSAGNISTVELRVTDTGIGIPKEQIPQLFRAFEQADGGIARKFGGTGLGLAISKSIVAMMDGEISVESEPQKGSVFTFTIRLERDATAHAPQKQPRDINLSGMRVMMLDSAAETRDYFMQIIKSFGITAETAETPEECLNKLDVAKSANQSYQVIFMDWNIPGVNSADFCGTLKERYGSCIIVLISVAQWSDIESDAERLGINRFLPKPLFPSQLFNALNEAVGIKGRRADPAQGTRYLFAGYGILLAEDVEVNREVIAMALEDTKVRMEYAENGKEALEFFEKNPNAYDLILMDINMPVMDGYEATRAIRSLPFERAKKIPILAMTANAFAEDIEKSLKNGMNDHLTKPIDFDRLFSKLQQYLIDYKLPVAAEKPGLRPAAAQNTPQNGGYEHMPVLKDYIDVDDALNRVRGNKKIYKTLLQSFVKNSGVPEFCEHVQAGDLDAAAKAAHSIKGASANLSLKAVNESAARLEQELKAGVLDKALYEELLSRFEKTKELIDGLMETLQ